MRQSKKYSWLVIQRSWVRIPLSCSFFLYLCPSLVSSWRGPFGFEWVRILLGASFFLLSLSLFLSLWVLFDKDHLFRKINMIPLIKIKQHNLISLLVGHWEGTRELEWVGEFYKWVNYSSRRRWENANEEIKRILEWKNQTGVNKENRDGGKEIERGKQRKINCYLKR